MIITAEEKRKQIQQWRCEDEELQKKEQQHKNDIQLKEIIKKIENYVDSIGLTVDYALSSENIKKLEEAGYIIKTGTNANGKKYTKIIWGKQKTNFFIKIKEAWTKLMMKL